jgi:hypothetical protein
MVCILPGRYATLRSIFLLELLKQRWAWYVRAVGYAFVGWLAVSLLLPNVVGFPFGSASTPAPTLPAEFAGYSGLTSKLSSSPPGRAIALYEYGSAELFHSWQTLVVGADRDTYRRADIGADEAPPVLLSPDGTQLLYLEPDHFTLRDLRTGSSSPRHMLPNLSNVGASTEMLAWSPDGRYLAYSIPEPPPGDGRAESSMDPVDGGFLTDLALLDLVSDTTVRFNDISSPRNAAFSPDGSRLAVQIHHELRIVTLDGRTERTLDMPIGAELAPRVAWSPDGKLLAVVRRFGAEFDFLRADGADQVVAGKPSKSIVFAGDRPGPILGWRSPTQVLVQQWLPGLGTDAIVGLSIADGPTTVLSRFSTASSCEFGMQVCQAYRIQLATGLLDRIGVRPSDPDRGLLAGLADIGRMLLIVLVLALLLRSLYRHRRPYHQLPRRPGPSPEPAEVAVATGASGSA